MGGGTMTGTGGGTMVLDSPTQLVEAVALIDTQLHGLPQSELMKVSEVFDMLLDIRNELKREEEP